MSPAPPSEGLRTVQIGLNSADTAGSLRFYSAGFGFQNGGGTGLWGYTIGIQGLPEDSRAMMWWLVGSQEFFQLEIFHHTRPAQRPLAEDWRPSDHGWTRFGVAVSDFDATLARLADFEVHPIAGTVEADGWRRTAVPDPYVGIVVEVLEQDPSAPGPQVPYMTCSVADLEQSRRIYSEALGFEILPLSQLHAPDHEALWGLPDARRDGFLVRAGSVLLEIVQYEAPAGRPKPADHRISDQGAMNVALGARTRAPVVAALDRLKEFGHVPPRIVDRGGERIAAYIVDREVELEFVSVPEEFDPVFGFVPTRGFLV